MTARLAKLGLVLVLALLPGTGAFAATGYSYKTIALMNSPAAGTSDSFGDFLDVTLDEAGRVAFSAPLASGFPNAGVWVDPGTGAVLLTRNGHAAPPPHTGTFAEFRPFTRLDGSGRAAYAAVLTGSVDGIFLDAAGVDSVLIAEGNAAPVPPGGTLAAAASQYDFFGMNSAGDIAFVSNVTGGTSPRGVFVRTGGVLSLLVGVGDSVFGGAETWTSFGRRVALNDAGRVAFDGVMGPVTRSGLFSRLGPTTTVLARSGDSAPNTSGGTFGTLSYPAINASGAVAFFSQLTGSVAQFGLFVASTGVDSVAVDGQSIPGAGPVTQNLSPPDISNDGTVAISLAFGGGAVASGVYLYRAGIYRPVALAGDVPPDTGGSAFATFGFLSRNETGRVAFVAILEDGRSGVFLATPTPAEVPLLSGPALLLLALLLAGSAAVMLRRFAH